MFRWIRGLFFLLGGILCHVRRDDFEVGFMSGLSLGDTWRTRADRLLEVQPANLPIASKGKNPT